MSQKFRVESQAIRDKLNSLLPSQNRGSIGVDLSGSTTIIPIVDLTEIAEGSSLRDDLQKSLSLTSVSEFDVSDTLSTIINTTGYYRVFCQFNLNAGSGGRQVEFKLTDGTTTKVILDNIQRPASFGAIPSVIFDFTILLQAGESLTCEASSNASANGVTRQIADLQGNLINP